MSGYPLVKVPWVWHVGDGRGLRAIFALFDMGLICHKLFALCDSSAFLSALSPHARFLLVSSFILLFLRFFNSSSHSIRCLTGACGGGGGGLIDWWTPTLQSLSVTLPCPSFHPSPPLNCPPPQSFGSTLNQGEKVSRLLTLLFLPHTNPRPFT